MCVPWHPDHSVTCVQSSGLASAIQPAQHVDRGAQTVGGLRVFRVVFGAPCGIPAASTLPEPNAKPNLECSQLVRRQMFAIVVVSAAVLLVSVAGVVRVVLVVSAVLADVVVVVVLVVIVIVVVLAFSVFPFCPNRNVLPSAVTLSTTSVFLTVVLQQDE